jgi:ATP-dependent helicase YprA (DUF1998 family)
MSATIQETIDELRRTLTDYIEATYHVGHPLMVEQRKHLLAKEGGIFRTPYLESTPRYVAGDAYLSMSGLPDAAKAAYVRLAQERDGKKAAIFDPPYAHQAQAIRETLSNQKNLMIMTGTGSGKTEAFLLPILGKLATEAHDKPAQFQRHSAIRAIVLYPMNALVNDQLGRLRSLFGHQSVIAMFEEWAGRPARFARYTSRTPYAGVRSPNKDGKRLSSIEDFFVEIENGAHRHRDGKPQIPEDDAKAFELMERLIKRGKWPSKPSVAGWYGAPHVHWKNRRGEYQRAVAGPHDAELLTRHEVQAGPPDLLITNYSMLEYMMMRPIERPIFDRTREWLAACPDEKVMVVLDEAHLYRGAQGAEVGLLLRRLRERLGIAAERFQVICATASFSEAGRANAGQFGAQLAGVPAESFVPVVGSLATRTPEGPGSSADVDALVSVDLVKFYGSDPAEQSAGILPFLSHRQHTSGENMGTALVSALQDFPPFNMLVNATMKAALPLGELGALVFPGAPPSRADTALTALLALGSRARKAPDEPSLLPCRVHSFFRGLPGLWVCMDPNCSELRADQRGGPAGKLYDQPNERCGCGAPVLEYFTCRYCGTSYARAYTNDVSNPQHLWAEPGHVLRTDAARFEAYQPLDLLLEEPRDPTRGTPATYDLRTGMLNPQILGDFVRTVYRHPGAGGLAATARPDPSAPPAGTFVPCACCNRKFTSGQSSVQDHQTKGDQPFQSLLGTQIRVQPPGPQLATEFAPLRGRKVLVFSDSRQVAARLAPTLQNYSLKDTVRALLPAGFQILANDPQFRDALVLDNAFLAVIVAAHRFGVRVRPELAGGEMMPRIESVPAGQLPSIAELMRLMNTQCPANLLLAIVNVLADKGLGLEALAIATVREAPRLTSRISALPDLPGVADDPATKLAVARAWLRCWQRSPGIWFNSMPPNWWSVEVTSHQGRFNDMEHILVTPRSKQIFKKDWLRRLLADLTQRSDDGGTRLLATNLSLEIGGSWTRCPTCKSVHRPIGGLQACIDCEAVGVENFDPDTDSVFRARRGFYRDPVARALNSPDPAIMSLIAAEHTAQLNAAQPEDAFSQAENHEIRFQDINIAWRDTDPREPAIDILSSTTTMEVGIDIGELSGVALRNMPPGRSNYQQRAGRAGRRGNAVATVIAFGSADSHDDHYFTDPDEMIRGPVIDPRLTLENADIARRHLRAYLLQRYHEARIPDVDPLGDPNLFSVLGRVRDFRSGTGVLHRDDFSRWLRANESELARAADRWLPAELSPIDRAQLIQGMVQDVTSAIDGAIGVVSAEDATGATTTGTEDPSRDNQQGDDDAAGGGGGGTEGADDDSANDWDDEFVDPAADKLLDRLLYWGVLPRYAFPTDVAPFYVFNRALSTPYRPKMEFAPSQGLNVALSQYAPNKQIWIKGKQYTSKAIFSPYRNERRDAWGKRKLYFECTNCGHAKTDDYDESRRGAVVPCEACKSPASFGPSKPWFRPPGFAHPVDRDPVSTPDAPMETAYATRAKLIMSTPSPDEDWISIGSRIRGFPTRKHLLVSNSGPDGDGYHYCTACGCIESESVVSREMNLHQPHRRPFPGPVDELCPGRVSGGVVLGTDFRTDIALFSLPLDAPFRVRPGNDETATALRTVCEAVSKAACNLLEIESGEILAEYRPALTDAGATGLEAEIFIYDTLAGGAGFSPQLVSRGRQLCDEALKILSTCPGRCDSSCYRCLRSFRNRLDHRLLDRHLGSQLLRHAHNGGYPDYDSARVKSSLDVLSSDLTRQFASSFEFQRNVSREVGGITVIIPILATRRNSKAETWVALGSPIAPAVPVHDDLRALDMGRYPILCVDDLLVRRHLPHAVKKVMTSAK